MNLGLHIILNPAGTFSFVGNVPICLSYERKNGGMLSAKEADEMLQSNFPALTKKRYGLVSRVWEKRSDAIEEAVRIGYIYAGNDSFITNQ
jgi:hypothetical protein